VHAKSSLVPVERTRGIENPNSPDPTYPTPVISARRSREALVSVQHPESRTIAVEPANVKTLSSAKWKLKSVAARLFAELTACSSDEISHSVRTQIDIVCGGETNTSPKRFQSF